MDSLQFVKNLLFSNKFIISNKHAKITFSKRITFKEILWYFVSLENLVRKEETYFIKVYWRIFWIPKRKILKKRFWANDQKEWWKLNLRWYWLVVRGVRWLQKWMHFLQQTQVSLQRYQLKRQSIRKVSRHYR